MLDPADNMYQYTYDADDRLLTATYPAASELHPVRTYIYNEKVLTSGTSLPNALTGVIDENNIRFASYSYDSFGRGVATEHADGAGRYTLAYEVGQTTVTDPLSTQRTHKFTTVQAALKTTGISQPGGSGCAAASNAMRYDANGNVASRTDFNGNKTSYTYELARNLETSRMEAEGTANARLVSTSWHAKFRLPLKVAEPKRISSFVYDVQGNLLSKTIQATSDSSGAQAFAAALVGAPRSWTYTYNGVGQILTETGPRHDVNDKSTFTYDSSGNLSSATNAVGHVTTFSNYDAHGHAGRVTAANGVNTDIVYDLRGRVLSYTAGSEVSTFEYDGIGQLRHVVSPNGASIAYDYDGGHRLTRVSDNLGNNIAYTLDGMGNRTIELVYDPDGSLARQTNRTYDALNRAQQITGAIQ